ncbi:hypothetical protein SAMN05421766_104775 [Zobellia uliginosa]|uniref:peptidylprolyl isomerase n=2 Tax=Zobellia uliginosa TaxID=143224 RepID=A0ABY1KXW2_9FLAO|nr:hypothetical protein SAMN05421766_104775 [Zobellia uliginosa]
MIMNRIVALSALVVVLWSCNNDDGGVTIEPPRPLTEVLSEDEVKIQEYLKTHYYNYAEFENPTEDFDYKIKVMEIGEGDTDVIPLIDQVKSKSVTVTATTEEGEEELAHTYYYLVAKEGVGESPTVADSTFVKYEGTLLDGTRFDGADSYSWQYLPRFLRGYAEGVSHLKSGGAVVENEDGTYTISDAGVGMVIMPSGLAYYNSTPSVLIPTYSPLVFTLELGVFVKDTDYDGDGVPSIMEDLNNDGNLNNDDTDGDGLPDHQDSDDDNDGVLTSDEIEVDGEGNVTFPDADGDNIPDYLDSDTK